MADYASGFSWPLIFAQVTLVVMMMRGNRSIVEGALKVIAMLLFFTLFHYLHFNSDHDLPETHKFIAGTIGTIVLISLFSLNEHFHRDWGNHTQRR